MRCTTRRVYKYVVRVEIVLVKDAQFAQPRSNLRCIWMFKVKEAFGHMQRGGSFYHRMDLSGSAVVCVQLLGV